MLQSKADKSDSGCRWSQEDELVFLGLEQSEGTQPFKEPAGFIVKAMKGTKGIVMDNVCDEQMTSPGQS